MLKISQKMGGLPTELQPVLKKIDETALTLHEVLALLLERRNGL